MIDLAIFFRQVRAKVFCGPMTVGQVQGTEKIIDYWQTKWGKMPLDEFAYLLATVFHETARKMQPVKEMGGDRYLRSKKYYPYVGVGLIQATWKRNWDILGIKSVEDGMQWPSALYAAFYGMDAGIYTGKRLSDFIGHGRRDYVNARRIINGLDKAEEIARIAEAFRSALIAAESTPAPIPEPIQEPTENFAGFKDWLITALREDEEIRNEILAIVFPEHNGGEDQAAEYDPNNELHDDYGQEEVAYAEDQNDQLDPRYGQA
jgi:hypothetical protein